jgi:hypothetical protein
MQELPSAADANVTRLEDGRIHTLTVRTPRRLD